MVICGRVLLLLFLCISEDFLYNVIPDLAYHGGTGRLVCD